MPRTLSFSSCWVYNKMEILNDGVTAVTGVSAVGSAIGIKKSGKKDLALICSSVPCNAAAVYTKNHVKGAPLAITKSHLKDGKAQAIIVASGVANVCTGKKGLKDAEKMAELAAHEMGIKKENVLVASTGVIGAFLPMGVIGQGIKGLKQHLSRKGIDAAEAILTTDAGVKQAAVKLGNITIGAIAKGAGMIHPNMATMLCFIFTDAKFSSSKLQTMLKKAADSSFNMISVDMDTSTSDMAILMANGLKGEIKEETFQEGLNAVCIALAKKVVTDGEGATKLIEVQVKDAKTLAQARTLARSVISSNLVKAACFGNDPNWGRILAAMGKSSEWFDQENVDIFIQGTPVVGKGIALGFNKSLVSHAMKAKELHILVSLNSGKEAATAWGCDLTHEYIRINAEYTT